MDSFEYTVDSGLGITSAPEQVTVDVQTNVAPVAVDDPLSSSTALLDSSGGSLIVDVLANDTDTNNPPDLPGGIDTGSVTILSDTLMVGTCAPTNPPDGTVTYSQPGAAVADSGTCTYQISDLDTAGVPFTATADITVDISPLQSDWDFNLDTDVTIPILLYDPGVPNASGNTADLPESGSYFSMAVSAMTTIYTVMTPGSDGGLIIGHNQTASGSHTGLPTGNEVAPVDLGWNFFGNTGMSWSTNGGIGANTDGTLKFDGDPAINNGQGRYQITWNGIPEIDLGGSAAFPQDLGFATINCDTSTPVDPANTALCADGDFFELVYDAHVPPGDPSGFGGVPYGLRMTGTVAFLDGAPQTSNGTISTFARMTATALDNPDVDPDPTDDTPEGVISQCVGDCFDYTITGVTDASVSIVLPLAAGIPASYVDGAGNTVNPELRVFDGANWGAFDTSGGDTVLSAAAVAGGPGLTCPPPGDAGYGVLTAGHRCLQVTIEDDGLNDKAGGIGTIMDPNGIGVPLGAAFVDNRTSGSSGCSISSSPSTLLQGGAWGLLAGFVALLGWRRTARQK